MFLQQYFQIKTKSIFAKFHRSATLKQNGDLSENPWTLVFYRHRKFVGLTSIYMKEGSYRFSFV